MGGVEDHFTVLASLFSQDFQALKKWINTRKNTTNLIRGFSISTKLWTILNDIGEEL